MRLLLSWVRDFVDVTASADDIAETLALRGFEVAAIEPLGRGDAVIDFEVTANRPDCLSVLGFAREIATTYDLPLRVPETAGWKLTLTPLAVGANDRIRVSVEDADLCPRYAAAVADITAARSPEWMTMRLQAAGVRPISPIVDITNYVLMELGHPTHAFDLARLAGPELRIRRARASEPLTTLDGVKRTLDTDMLAIADADRAQAVGGVMGGADSEVSSSTRTVVFESAYFKPASVRRTSKRLGLKTEASARFERGADINAPVTALQRIAGLVHEIGAGRIAAPVVDVYPHPRGQQHLHLRRDRLAHLLGLEVPDRDVVRILRALGLAVRHVDDGWRVEVPTFRVDLLREVDLIEEVGRHYGLDKLEPTFPPVTVAAPRPDPRVTRDHLVRCVLTAAGLSEAITFGFVTAAAAERFAPGGDTSQLIAVANPLSAMFDTMRPSLIPGLADSVGHNRRHGLANVALFEIGARFTASAGETRGLGIIWSGAAEAEHWSTKPRNADFFDVKGVVERLAGVVGVQVRLEPADVAFLRPGQSARVLVGDTQVGVIGTLAAAAAESSGIPEQDRVVVAEIDLDRLAALTAPDDEWVRPVPRHPAIVRDLSIVVAESLPAEIIRGTIHSAAVRNGAPLTAIAFFDRYQGKGVLEGSVSLSLRLTFQADRTLTDADVQAAFDQILAALVREHGAVQR